MDEPTGQRIKRRPTWLIWVFLVDIIIVAAVLYYIYGNDEAITPPATTQPVQGALIDSGELPEVAPLVKDDPLLAEIDALLAESEYLEDSDIQASESPTLLNDPANAKYTSITFEDIGDWKSKSDVSTNGKDSTEAIEVPQKVRGFDEKLVSIPGYMQPLRFKDGKVSHFMLMRNQMLCCYGIPIGPTDWIDIKTPPGQSVDPMLYAPVIVMGTLEVGEKVNSTTSGLFKMTCDKVLPPGVMP